MIFTCEYINVKKYDQPTTDFSPPDGVILHLKELNNC